MLAQGVPVRVAMEALGHFQLSTTSDINQYVDRQALNEATTRVASQLFGAG